MADYRALAKAGKTVLHIDPNDYYGSDQASLTLDELITWSGRHGASSLSSISYPQYSYASTSSINPSLEKDKRRYALSLFPAVLPSRGELIDTLITSDVSKYVSFRLLDTIAIWVDDPESQEVGGTLRRVPGSKEAVFKDKSVSLMDKRRLMKFLMFAGGEFEEDDLLKGISRFIRRSC